MKFDIYEWKTEEERISVRYRDHLDFQVPTDRVLVNALKLTTRRIGDITPRVEDLTVEKIFNSGLLSRSHIIDVGSDNPHQFEFSVFSETPTVSGGTNHAFKLLGEYPGAMIRDWAMVDFPSVKREAVPLVSTVNAVLAGRSVEYNRLVIPMSLDGRVVSHLFVSFTENLIQVD